METIIFSLNLVAIFIIVAVVLALNYFLLKKYIFFWFDPLLIYIVFNSFSIAFVIYLYFWEHQIKEFYLITFFLSSIGLLAGIIFRSNRSLKKLENNTIVNSSPVTNYEQVFDVFMIISIIILISTNLAMLVSLGTLPILSDDPSVAKVELYTGGWGIARRIDLVLVNFVFTIALLKLYHPVIQISLKKKVMCFACIIIAVLVLITMGAKASLLNILDSLFGVYMINLFFSKESFSGQFKSNINLSAIKSVGKYFFIGAVGYMLLIIVKSGVETSVGNSFITRLVGSGDTFYFFYTYDIYDNFKLGPVDFIKHIINPITGFLRLSPYEYPIGAYILNYAFGLPLSSFGPNAQHHIEGLLYFGRIGTFFYSFGIGYLIAHFRLALLYKVFKKPDFFRLVMYVSFVSIIVAAAVEIDYFLLLFYDIIMFGSILFLISLMLTNYLKVVKRFGLLNNINS